MLALRVLLKRIVVLSSLCHLVALIVLAGCAAAPPTIRTGTIRFGFEDGRAGELPTGWFAGHKEDVQLDSSTASSGHQSVRIARTANSAEAFSGITKTLSIDFSGQTVELRGAIRTAGADGGAELWLREDGAFGRLHFINMGDWPVRGTQGWGPYSIQLPLDREARTLAFGGFLQGGGTAWFDDLEILIDGKPLGQAPKREMPAPTAVETDHAFDKGSGIELTTLTPPQVDNLAALGRVWGFLKYHHPEVASGKYNWDYELFRIMPRVLAAADRSQNNQMLSDWIAGLGVPQHCDPCASLPADMQLPPPTTWIHSEERWGRTLVNQLETIFVNRFSGGEQLYVSAEPALNPGFHELSYSQLQTPDAGLRILALYRFWNDIEYWSPYRDLVSGSWQATLSEFLPRFVSATTRLAYEQQLQLLIARLGDGHANLMSPEAQPPAGTCRWPIDVRSVEGRAVVTALYENDTGFKVGDVIRTVDAKPVSELFSAWAPYYSASNDSHRLMAMAMSIPKGECGESRAGIERDGRTVDFAPKRTQREYMPVEDDHPGESFQMLSADIAYLKVSSIRAADIDGYLERAAGARGLVVDLRGYPKEPVVYGLGPRLVGQATPFVQATHAVIPTPGAFVWGKIGSLEPRRPTYRGKVAILVNTRSQSQTEFATMALRVVPDSIVIGTPTAGADGNVSTIVFPGGLQTRISGLGIFYPDGRPTQQIGIVPDLIVAPTIAGIRAGRDEVLEAAMAHLVETDRLGVPPPDARADPARR